MGLDFNFWKNKRVLVTGHTGFKGSWLSLWLQRLQAEVVGLSLDPPTNPSLYHEAKVHDGMTSLRGDIRDLKNTLSVFNKFQPEVVLHLAAQSLVRRSYADPVETYSTNVMGTLNVLEGIRSVKSVRSAVMVTTDKCYENKEWAWGYREIDPMGGHDPYSSSKGCSELLISSYRNSYFPISKLSDHKTAIASARAGNVIGGGDWAEDRLIPDILRSFKANQKVRIRSPHAIRPWQHVLDPLSGYLQLAQSLADNGAQFAEAWNFGPRDDDALPVSNVVEKMAALWGPQAAWAIDSDPQPHEASYLKLDCSKAHARLKWSSRWPLEVSLQKIVGWHKSHENGEPARLLCENQISEFMNTTN